MKKSVFFKILSIMHFYIFVIIIFSCSSGNNKKDLASPHLRIINILSISETVDNINNKKKMFAIALNRIKELGEISGSNPEKSMNISLAYGFYYYQQGDYLNAESFLKKSIEYSTQGKLSNHYALLLEARILFNKGKYEDVLTRVNQFILQKPNIALSYIILGDYYFIRSDFIKARNYYEKVFVESGPLDILAASRLETMDEVVKLKIPVNKYKSFLLRNSVSRGELCYFLDKIINISKKLWGKNIKKTYVDIEKSLYENSILEVVPIGFFSFIETNKFDPYREVNREELAGIIEDYIVLKTKKRSYRMIYKNFKKSKVKDIKKDSSFFNAINLAVERDILDLSLGGDFKPGENVSALEVIRAFEILLNK